MSFLISPRNLSTIFIRLEAIGSYSRIFDLLSSAHRMHDFTDFRQLNFTKFKHNTSIGVAMNLFETEFWTFCRKGSFCKKTQKSIFSTSCDFSRHNSAMIIDRRKFIIKRSLYGMSSFHFTVGIKVIPMACTLRTRNLPKFSTTSDATWRHTTHNADAGSDDRVLSHVTCPSWQKIEM